jgi:Dolichyl-phosphate-mannose-protein mannosyltransferase
MNRAASPIPAALPVYKWALGCTFILAASLFLSLRFMGIQVIHMDETTQLSGASLPPFEMLRWLAGENPGRFGVPSDRMPPLYYLLQQAWAVIFGTSITAYRALSLASAFSGLLLFASIVRRISPGIWGMAVLAILALSMNYIQYSVVIRPYPLFFALGCACCYALMRYCEVRDTKHETRWLIAVTAIGIVATYTHFYGVIMFCATQAALALLALWERRSIWPHVIAVVISAVIVSALYPLFFASLGVKTTIPHANVSEFPKLLYRMVASRAAAVYAPVQAGLLAGIASAILLSFSQLLRRMLKSPRRLDDISGFRLVAFVVAGLSLAVSLAAAAIINGFNVLEPHYHVWLFPFVYVLLLFPNAHLSKQAAQLQATGIALALVATLTSTYIFYRNMSVFASGPAGAMQAVINKLPEGTPVIYDNTQENSWYFSTYPIHFVHQGRVRQYLFDTAKPESGFIVAEANNIFFAPKLETATAEEVIDAKEFLIFARVDDLFVEQASRFIRFGEPSIPNDMADRKFSSRFGYEVVENVYTPANTAIRISVLKRNK